MGTGEGVGRVEEPEGSELVGRVWGGAEERNANLGAHSVGPVFEDGIGWAVVPNDYPCCVGTIEWGERGVDEERGVVCSCQ